MKPSITDSIFRFTIQHRSSIIYIYKILYAAVIAVWLSGLYATYYLTDNYLTFYQLAVGAGKTALVMYILTVIPGIGRRFKLRHKLFAILMILRRYNGILMFLLILTHYSILRGVAVLRSGLPKILPAPFELFGLSAFVLTFFLFITSNDYSIRLLKKGWRYIHNLTYVIIGLITLHVLLQQIDMWGILIGITLLLQCASLVYRLYNPPTATPVVKPGLPGI